MKRYEDRDEIVTSRAGARARPVPSPRSKTPTPQPSTYNGANPELAAKIQAGDLDDVLKDMPL